MEKTVKCYVKEKKKKNNTMGKYRNNQSKMLILSIIMYEFNKFQSKS